MTLRILEPGLCTLVVDQGRPRTRSLGVPHGGAFDRQALAVGNTLVGNPPDAPALEVTLVGPSVQAECDLGCSFFGAPFDLAVGTQRLPPGSSFTLHAGDVLRIGGTPTGARGYLCVAGGIQSAVVLESRSSLHPLKSGTTLHCSPGRLPVRFLAPSEPAHSRKLRVLDGGQSSWFDTAEFYSQHYAVSPLSNRMGLRLQGKPLRLPDRELLSEPVCPGAVQVTRDGQCIVLGVDGQTIGGYAKVAQVVAADLDQLGQLRPGARIEFERIPLAEAEALFRKHRAKRARALLRLRTAIAGG